MDVFSTVLDYLNAGHLDDSDGHSLRPRIEGKLYNAERYEDVVVVAELGRRVPLNSNMLSGELGSEPNFMVRHGDYKPIIPKLASSSIPDMLFNLKRDPLETIG